jgi:DNA polymerase III delta subunit
MLIFLYGPDDYRRIQKKRELIAEFAKKRSELGLRTFDLAAPGGGWRDDFEEFSRSQSLFEPARLAVFENAFELEAPVLAKLLEPFSKAGAKSATPLTILLSERDKPVKALAFLLEKPTISQKFENLEGAEWTGFIATEAKRQGITLTPQATQFLADVYQGNSWALATELQKLNSYKKIIDKKDLDAFDLAVAPNYWMLMNGLKSPDARTRLITLERLLATGDAPAKIFNILAASSPASDGATASASEKTARAAEFDFQIKSGKLDYEEALVDLAIS